MRAPVKLRHTPPLVLFLFVLALACLLPRASALAQSDVPEGFEDLNRPQQTLVDVIYQGEPLGSFLVTYTDEWIAFDRPDAVAGEVPSVAAREAVRRALSGRLDTHAERLCAPGDAEDSCGFVETSSAAVLFDRGRFTVEVFVAPDLLQSPESGPRYLEPPPNEPSIVQSFSAAGSGARGGRAAGGDRNRGAMRSFTLLGFGATRLRAANSFSSDDGAAADVAVVEHDRESLRYRAGLYRTTLLDTLGERRVVAAGATRTLDLRTDISEAPGTPLVVTLQRRAVVEVLRNGRVLDSQIYRPGTQRLDTDSLPSGAYPVTLRIDFVGGGSRTEERFFVKDRLIPPADQPDYTFEAGLLTDNASPGLPETGAPVVHAGHARRLTDRLGVGLNLAASDAEAAGEGSLFLRGRWGELQASTFASTDRQAGASLRAFGNSPPVFYSLQARRIWNLDRNGAATGSFTDSSAVQELVPDRRDRTALDLTLDYQLPSGGLLGVNAEATWAEARETRYSGGPRVQLPLFTRGGLDVSLQAEASFGREETLAFASIRLSWLTADTSAFVETGYRYSDRPQTPSTPYADAQVNRRLLDSDRRDLTLGVGASAGLSDDVRADLQYSGPNADADLGVDRSLSGDGSTRYFGTASTTVLGNLNGVALAGRDSDRAGVLVQVTGARDTRFDVLVDDRRRATVAPGESADVPLDPYDRYEVRLRRKAGPFVAFDDTARSVRVYPGTVRTLTWETAPIVAVFAQAVRPDGSPVANALLVESEARIRTDAQGYFQAEVGTQDGLILRPAEGPTCRIDLPDFAPDTEFRDLGQLTCKETDR